jgi:hypothetical protein
LGEDFGEMQVEDLNRYFTMLECSPMKNTYCKNKENKFWKKKGCASKTSCHFSRLAKVLNLPSTPLSQVLNN